MEACGQLKDLEKEDELPWTFLPKLTQLFNTENWIL